MEPATGREAVVALILTALAGCTSDGSSENAAEDLVSDAATPSEQVPPESAPPTPPDGDPPRRPRPCPSRRLLGRAAPPGEPSWLLARRLTEGVVLCVPHHGDGVGLPAGEPDPREGRAAGGGLPRRRLQHLGVDTQHWVPWATLMYLPSREQVDPGAQVRCDVADPADYPGSRPRRHTYATVDAAATGDNAVWGCQTSIRADRPGSRSFRVRAAPLRGDGHAGDPRGPHGLPEPDKPCPGPRDSATISDLSATRTPRQRSCGSQGLVPTRSAARSTAAAGSACRRRDPGAAPLGSASASEDRSGLRAGPGRAAGGHPLRPRRGGGVPDPEVGVAVAVPVAGDRQVAGVAEDDGRGRPVARRATASVQVPPVVRRPRSVRPSPFQSPVTGSEPTEPSDLLR